MQRVSDADWSHEPAQLRKQDLCCDCHAEPKYAHYQRCQFCRNKKLALAKPDSSVVVEEPKQVWIVERAPVPFAKNAARDFKLFVEFLNDPIESSKILECANQNAVRKNGKVTQTKYVCKYTANGKQLFHPLTEDVFYELVLLVNQEDSLNEPYLCIKKRLNNSFKPEVVKQVPARFEDKDVISSAPFTQKVTDSAVKNVNRDLSKSKRETVPRSVDPLDPHTPRELKFPNNSGTNKCFYRDAMVNYIVDIAEPAVLDWMLFCNLGDIDRLIKFSKLPNMSPFDFNSHCSASFSRSYEQTHEFINIDGQFLKTREGIDFFRKEIMKYLRPDVRDWILTLDYHELSEIVLGCYDRYEMDHAFDHLFFVNNLNYYAQQDFDRAKIPKDKNNVNNVPLRYSASPTISPAISPRYNPSEQVEEATTNHFKFNTLGFDFAASVVSSKQPSPTVSNVGFVFDSSLKDKSPKIDVPFQKGTHLWETIPSSTNSVPVVGASLCEKVSSTPFSCEVDNTPITLHHIEKDVPKVKAFGPDYSVDCLPPPIFSSSFSAEKTVPIFSCDDKQNVVVDSLQPEVIKTMEAMAKTIEMLNEKIQILEFNNLSVSNKRSRYTKPIVLASDDDSSDVPDVVNDSTDAIKSILNCTEVDATKPVNFLKPADFSYTSPSFRKFSFNRPKNFLQCFELIWTFIIRQLPLPFFLTWFVLHVFLFFDSRVLSPVISWFYPEKGSLAVTLKWICGFVVTPNEIYQPTIFGLIAQGLVAMVWLYAYYVVFMFIMSNMKSLMSRDVVLHTRVSFGDLVPQAFIDCRPEVHKQGEMKYSDAMVIKVTINRTVWNSSNPDCTGILINNVEEIIYPSLTIIENMSSLKYFNSEGDLSTLKHSIDLVLKSLPSINVDKSMVLKGIYIYSNTRTLALHMLAALREDVTEIDFSKNS